jgi:sortase (surface protein transpeptidase)
MRLLGRIWGILATLRHRLSKTRARLHFAGGKWPRGSFIVAAIMLCGGAVLLAWGLFGLFEGRQESSGNLPAGDLRAITAPGRDDEGTAGPTATSVGQNELVPAATTTPAGYEKAIPTATTVPLPDVAPPTRMIIEKIGVDAPIITLGLDANSRPEVPYDPYVVTWYDFSAKPGQGSNAVFSGHVDWTVNGQPVTGVFWGLRDLAEGDMMKIILEDATELRYRVTDNVAVPYDDPEGEKAMYPTPNDVITLISCGGTWVPNPSSSLGGNYTHRVVVRAERVT